MSEGTVIDIKSRSPIFNPPLRQKLEDAVEPFLEDGAMKAKVVSTAEQVICTAMVCAARSFAEKLASKLFERIGAEKPTPQ